MTVDKDLVHRSTSGKGQRVEGKMARTVSSTAPTLRHTSVVLFQFDRSRSWWRYGNSGGTRRQRQRQQQQQLTATRALTEKEFSTETVRARGRPTPPGYARLTGAQFVRRSYAFVWRSYAFRATRGA